MRIPFRGFDKVLRQCTKQVIPFFTPYSSFTHVSRSLTTLNLKFTKVKTHNAIATFECWPLSQLGHFGLCVADFPAQVAFYTTHFNLVPSDFLHVDDETTPSKKRDVALFAHIDRGEDYVDHHTFFMSSNPTSHVHHCSFEVHDFDTQLLGHQWVCSSLSFLILALFEERRPNVGL